MSITLTESAAKRVLNHLETKQGFEGLKLSVKNAGCSGLAYIQVLRSNTPEAGQPIESRWRSSGSIWFE